MSASTPRPGRRILSIGHSNQSLEAFLGLLRLHQIEVLVDARSHPYSKHAPHFDARPLKEAVKASGIKYLYLGKELGGRPAGAEFYDADGHVLYGRVAQSPLFLEGIRRLEEGAQKYRIALMCSEENPTSCHRRLLIGRVLAARGLTLDHIRGDGRIQAEMELANTEGTQQGGEQPGLFGQREERAWRSTRSVLPRRPQLSSSER